MSSEAVPDGSAERTLERKASETGGRHAGALKASGIGGSIGPATGLVS